MTSSLPRTARFLAYDDGESFHLVELPLGVSFLGRSAHSVLPLDGAGIALRHAAVIVSDAGDVDIVDDGSLTGTWVEGERVWRRRLGPGDAIRIGNATIGFVAVDATPAGALASAA